MKKLFSIVLAVVMVLGVAASAMAFNWAKPADADGKKFGYEIDAIKFTRQTGTLGSSLFNADDNATAVNGADVYFAIKLTVSSPDDDVKAVAKADVTFVSLNQGDSSGKYLDLKDFDLSALANGVYYYDPIAQDFLTIDQFVQNSKNAKGNKVAETPVNVGICLDTDTAKVTAKVKAKTPIPTTGLKAGDYEIDITNTQANSGDVIFNKGGKKVATFKRNTKGLVTSVEYVAGKEQDVLELYKWLNDGSADAIYNAIKNKEMYMTDDNLLAAFGMNFSSSDSITWKANSTPIILDPNAGTAGIGIPKTGDASSVVGFAMIMVAIVAAAVAVKKVKA